MSNLCKNAPWYDCPECKNTQHGPRPVEDSSDLILEKWKENYMSLVEASNKVDEVRLRVGDPIDVLSYLFTPERDFLIRNTGPGNEPDKVYASDLMSKKYIAIFCFYLPVLADDVCFQCNGIIQSFKELQQEGKSDFEAVLVTRMIPDFPSLMLGRTPSDIFSEFLSWFPCFLAVPLSDSDTSTERLFPCTGSISYTMNGSLIADLEHQKVVHTDLGGTAFSKYGAYFYPFTPERLSYLEEQQERIGPGTHLETLFGCQTSHVLDRVSSPSIGETVSSLKKKVVWIYLLSDGGKLDRICDLYEKCKSSGHEFEVVLVNAKCSHKNWNLSWEQYRRPLDKNKVCWEWLELPYSDKVNRRLWVFCDRPESDTLLIVGPDASYVVPNAFRIYHHLGIQAYPFTRQAALCAEVDRVQRLRLLELLTDAGINYLFDRNFTKVEVSRLAGSNVVLYFSDVPLGRRHYPCWEDHVAKWFEEFKSQEEPFEMIYVCTYQPDNNSFFDKCSKLPCLAVPNDKDYAETLLKKLFGTAYDESTLVAFGSDGRLLAPFLEEKLGFGIYEVEPWSFADPRNAMNLVIYECKRLLDYQLNTITNFEDFVAVSDD